MKTTTKMTIIAALIFNVAGTKVKATDRVAVLRIETSGRGLDPYITAQLFRSELKKMESLEVVEKEEMNKVLQANGLAAKYFSENKTKFDAGKALKCKNVIVGELTATANKYYFKVKVFDVENEAEIKRISRTYSYEPENLENFIALTLKPLFVNETNSVSEIVRKADSIKVASAQQNNEEPEYTKVSMAGPRLGYTFLTGSTANAFKIDEKLGGYGMSPAMFQFGYQFEAQYAGNGTIQGLVEFIPTITGMDQGHAFPSLTLLNGVRNSRYGFEVALGPTFFTRKIGYINNTYMPSPRGELQLTSGVVIALGKSFRSGNLNIPINAYAVPGKNGWRFGISAGFNLKNTTRKFKSQTY